MIRKVYFDANRVALGTSEDPDAFYSEEFDLDEDTSVVGMTESDIRALHEISRANRPELREIIETAHADSRREREQYEKGLMTPFEFAKSKASIWSQAQYEISSRGM